MQNSSIDKKILPKKKTLGKENNEAPTDTAESAPVAEKSNFYLKDILYRLNRHLKTEMNFPTKHKPCIFCNKYVFFTSMEKHVLDKHNTKYFKCNTCSTNFYNRELLIFHCLSEHPEQVQ